MNASADSPQLQGSTRDQDLELPLRETAPAADDKVCLIEVRHIPYLPDQQVELLHLQAEADALLLQLQAMQQKRQTQAVALN
jgi:hypothetical protein